MDIVNTGLLELSDSMYVQVAEFLIVLIAGILITRFVAVPIVSRLVDRGTDSKKLTHQIRNLIGIVGVFASLIAALQAGEFGNLVTVIGTIAAALTVAIGFGMRDMVANLVSGVFIHLDNPFVKGDYVKIGDYEGEVKEINLKNTILNGHSAEKIEVPNGMVATVATRNFTKRRMTKCSEEIDIDLRNIDEVSRQLEEAAEAVEDVVSNPAPETQVIDIVEGKATVELHFWTRESQNHRRIKSLVLRRFSSKAAEAGLFEEIST